MNHLVHIVKFKNTSRFAFRKQTCIDRDAGVASAMGDVDAKLSDRILNGWKQKSQTEKRLTALTVLLCVVAASLSIVSAITGEKLLSTEGRFNSICKTKECVQTASEIINNIDSSVNPCDDFDHFVCGKFQKRSVIPGDHLKTSTYGRMQEDVYFEQKKLVESPVSAEDKEITIKTRNLFASCMSSDAKDGSVEALRQLLFRLGGWPVIDREWDHQDLNLERRMAILFAHGSEPLIYTVVNEDEKNATKYVLDVYIGSLILKDRFYIEEKSLDHIRYIQHYKNMFVSTARLFNVDESTIQKDVNAMLRFEKEYATISYEETKKIEVRWRRNRTENGVKRFSVSQLEKFIPTIKWGNFLDYTYEYFKLPTPRESLSMRLDKPDFVRRLMFLVKKTTHRTLANYLTWRFVYKSMPYLDVHFRRLYYDFVKEVPFQNFNQLHFSRWRECIGIVANTFQMPLTSLYAKEKFDATVKDEILSLISSVKNGFVEVIHKQDWLDGESKKLGEEKVRKMRTKMAFPRYVLNPEALVRDFSELHLSNDRFLENMLKILRHNTKTELSVLTGDRKREQDWIPQPLDVNTVYKYYLNTIIFPIAMLRSPVFRSQRPKYINYGVLGVMIGQEMGHGFDTIGSLFNQNGVEKHWWKKEARDKYKELANCYVEQYSNLSIDMTRFRVNGNETLNDNIADNAGLKSSYQAYIMYASEHGEEQILPGLPYSASQLFFIAYGQRFCELLTKTGNEKYFYDQRSPARYRTNVPLMNSLEFAEAFNCPKGSPMNPQEKCSMWN